MNEDKAPTASALTDYHRQDRYGFTPGWNVDTIVLAGVSTHNCIAQTAADAFGHNLRVIYAAEATASENPEAAAAVQDILCREYRQRILPIAGIINRLMTPRKGQEVLT